FRWDDNWGSAIEPGRARQVLLFQESGVEQFRLIVAAGIGEDRYDRLARPQLLRQADRAGDIDAGRAAEHEALFLHELEQDRQHLLVGDLVLPVVREALEVAGLPVVADALRNRVA